MYESYWRKMWNKCNITFNAYSYVTDFVRSELNKLAGDVKTFEKDESYIKLITSPNNPNGIIREHVVNGDQGKLIYDLAYYWPQYTSITSHANHDVMLFTISKCTGHVGSRIGFGSDSRNVRISMLSNEDFNIFLKMLMAIQGSTNRK
ncbi:hypothetical protein H5410_002394 [Solanum commersonii]|uniref:Alliinase C-terminal domain-containing protein n=1 Tax=Solanum commersonii TaxID=4109 RepID=A0A9J6B1M5_SOLCO|nr:hypothetical protein H5410_002394 [Solanum commersonii]